jgi:UDP-N-acetylglucosamine 2-epimerase (non-hydrolysing)/GDP/UDP-N,N'-diacetylbacillosamine 2-epimerase (hydrolysing)
MGEEEWRVHRAGAPSLDHLRRSSLLTRAQLEEKLECELSVPTVLVSYHPVTLADDTLEEAEALFSALSQLPGSCFFVIPTRMRGAGR